MRLIFCSDPWDRLSPDPVYDAEVRAAVHPGLEYSLISFEALVDRQDVERAVRGVEPASGRELGIYRGWMLRPEIYARLYTALTERGIWLINTPEAYKHCHYLPEAYAAIKDFTPLTTWLKCGLHVSIDDVMAALQIFGDRPIIVKDFVKSRKHEWSEACYIPSASDRQAVERVVTHFLQLQGDDLQEGLVFREFVTFEPLTIHSKSGMPLTREYRLFFLDGEVMLCTQYWEEGDYSDTTPPLTTFSAVAKNVRSRFFTLDVARKLDGDWMIVEPGDGQVAGLPERADVQLFYSALAGLA